ncbi:replication factor C large subunit [Staphylothermus hellenicus]|uniref:Replication factor C large subunit n=1 Tax=Staphylothermus hellenicus (strain DSM 12710 / JCM 10830 / BK20S6-10-b1 / P8) TaxID=591019 RepID=D7D985_STAHD|nr:replication factor C large subunit [Staphylothermus hellenicus]ADI32331.1 AAA ATPase central domain protein [Staphylothermus hellenicus DSM 12710]
MPRRIPWIIKYRPKKIADVVNQDKAKKQFIQWLESWLKGKPSKKAALLYGPAGCGKTSLVEAAANEYGLEIVEMNASDFRRRQDIERIAKTAASMRSLFARGKIILLDEVDGISGTADKGAIYAILHLLEITRYPVVMTANNPWDQKLRPLRDASLMISFKRLTERNVVIVLKRICQFEKLECEDAALKEIARRSEGDLRSAINDLQAIAEGFGRVTLNWVRELSAYRTREYAPFEALKKMFNAKYIFQAKSAISQANIDYETMMIWINEHIPTYYDDPEEIWRAYEALSRADVYMGRIRKTGSWDLLSYVFDMMGPGVAFARKIYRYRWKPFRSPQRLQLLAHTKRSREVREGIAMTLAPRLITSRTTIKRDVIPFLKIIFTQAPKYAARIALAYGLTEEMIKWLAGPKSSEVLAYYRRFKR